MTKKPVCAVIIPLGEGEATPPAAALASIERCDDGYVFAAIHTIPAAWNPDPAKMRNAAVAKALAGGADWIFFLEDGQLCDGAFTQLAPAMQNHQVIWGAQWVIDGEGGKSIPKISRFTCHDRPDFFHMVLHWWVSRSHMISAAAARDTPFRNIAGGAWYGDYLLRLWQGFSCLKTAQGITIAAELAAPSDADNELLIKDLAITPRFISFPYCNRRIKLVYTGKNPAIERVQLRGVFYEQDDLNTLVQYVKPGAVIADIGANTGNHSIFFATVLAAKKIIALEPNPTSIFFLKEAIIANGLDNIDLSKLGIGIGAVETTARISTGRRGHLGSATLNTGSGDVPVMPLDMLVEEKLDLLKIDVESMEIDVLIGAQNIIRRDRPVILVEVVDENITSLLDIIVRLGYKIEKIFADHGYSNYLLVPGASEG